MSGECVSATEKCLRSNDTVTLGLRANDKIECKNTNCYLMKYLDQIKDKKDKIPLGKVKKKV